MKGKTFGLSSGMAGSATLPLAEKTMPSTLCSVGAPAGTRPDSDLAEALTIHVGSPPCQLVNRFASATRSCRCFSAGVLVFLSLPSLGVVRLLAAVPTSMRMGIIEPVACARAGTMADMPRV